MEDNQTPETETTVETTAVEKTPFLTPKRKKILIGIGAAAVITTAAVLIARRPSASAELANIVVDPNVDPATLADALPTIPAVD